ncbi:MAG: prealbumin-like fold domain-containing protein [Candidatus Limnocylindrales bacterium]
MATLVTPALVVADEPSASPAASPATEQVSPAPAATPDPVAAPDPTADLPDPTAAPVVTADPATPAPPDPTATPAPVIAPATDAPVPTAAPATPEPLLAYAPNGPPTIASDKADYAPSETVTLTGTNWAAGESVRIVVNDTYGSSWQRDVTVAASDQGMITDSFSLPYCFVSNYDVKASGPVSGTATTTFTDLPIGTYDQCSNDLGSGYPSGDTGCRWVNGNLERNNSTYSEGDATVQRLWLTDLVPGSVHTLTLQYGTTKGGHHAYDFLTTWDWSENWITDADRCQDITGCTTATEDTLAIPTDPNAEGLDVLLGDRLFVMRGGSLTAGSATTPTIVSGDYTGDSETAITITFTVDPATGAMCTTDKKDVTTCGVALWFGAHVALTAQWTAIDGTTGAGGISGSPYHVALVQLDGAAVGQRDNQMQAGAVLKNGSVVIVKDAVPNDPQDFSFNLTGGVINQDFSLDDDADPTLPSSQTFSLPAGTYTANELNIPAGWTLTNLACVVTGTNGTTTDVASPTATITLKTGFDTSDTVTCTYTDTHYSDLGISKTASPSLTRTYAWGISKAVDKTTVKIADGGAATFGYTVNVTHDTGTDSLWGVTGQITVTNSNSVAVSGVAVTDAINDANATCDVTGGSTTIASGGSATFDYTCTYTAAPAAQTQTNTATVTWTAFGSVHTTASATRSVDWSAATITRVDTSVDVTDTFGGTLGTVSYTDASPTTFTYSKTFTGDPGGTCTNHDNTATFTTNDTATTGSASKQVTVCVGKDLTVTKTAAGTFNRAYLWKIAKDVDKTTVNIADGDTATFGYTVKVDQTGFTDSGYTLSGKITVANPNDWEAITADVSDSVDNGGACTVTGGTAVTIPASGSKVLDYSCTFSAAPNSYSGTNTATAAWDKAVAFTPNASATGTAEFTLGQVGATNKTITVTDTLGGTLGTVTATDGVPFASATFTYSHDFAGVGGTCTKYDNTATITETDQSASKEVTVCVGLDLTVSKTAAGTFDRTYLWKIAKAVDKTTATIASGGDATFNYTVTAEQTGFTDSGWTLSGVITVTNPNDWEDVTLTSLADVVDNGGACTLAAGPYTVMAGKTLDVAYSCTYASASSLSGHQGRGGVRDPDRHGLRGQGVHADPGGQHEQDDQRHRHPRRHARHPHRGRRDPVREGDVHVQPRLRGRRRDLHQVRQHRDDHGDRCVRQADRRGLRRARPHGVQDGRRHVRPDVPLVDRQERRQDLGQDRGRRLLRVHLHGRRRPDRVHRLRLDAQRQDHGHQPQRLGGGHPGRALRCRQQRRHLRRRQRSVRHPEEQLPRRHLQLLVRLGPQQLQRHQHRHGDLGRGGLLHPGGHCLR